MICVISIILVSVIALHLKHDLDLSKNILPNKLPDIMVENLDFARVINGKEWRMKASYAESGSGMIKARSLDIDMYETTTKRNSRIYASWGEYSTKTEKMWFHDVEGVTFLGDSSVDFAASRADYDSSDDVWYFSEGITVSDDKVFVSGDIAKIDQFGVLSMGKGARVRWITK
jgi:hypothetical protein